MTPTQVSKLQVFVLIMDNSVPGSWSPV